MDVFPSVPLDESWIKCYFRDDEIWRCSATFKGLPSGDPSHESVPSHIYTIMKEILTCSGTLPVGHNGCCGFKPMVETRYNDFKFEGLIWAVFTNGRIVDHFRNFWDDMGF